MLHDALWWMSEFSSHRAHDRIATKRESRHLLVHRFESIRQLVVAGHHAPNAIVLVVGPCRVRAVQKAQHDDGLGDHDVVARDAAEQVAPANREAARSLHFPVNGVEFFECSVHLAASAPKNRC